jgi:hypothetical protein|tara:strand:+ start:463 stop:708 length:246 start_codon:yes stop_codon:yes gene_type:complete
MAKKTEEVIDEPVDTEQAVPEAPAPEPAGLQLSDIAAVVKIIDVVTKRGAFNGDELGDVGSVRNRLQAFVIASQPEPEEKK